MLGKKSGQIDIFNSMIYEKLIPKNHLLVKIDEIIDFSFVYEIVEGKYSEIGRKSYDPIVVFKLCLLEYLYVLSDIEVVIRAKTDVAFRWFLGLNIDDEIPDDTTISHFRIHRLGTEGFESVFNEIIRKCIEKDLISKKRYIIDSTDVAANVNYPSTKKLICNAFRKVIKQIDKFNSSLADKELKAFENDIELEYQKSDKVPLSIYCKIAREHAEYIYLKTYDELQLNNKYKEVYSMLWDIIEQYSNPSSKDKIISCVDPDARVAHKSPGNRKRGYKNHILVDEDSEIILSSTQTPFNVNDDKELKNLIEKSEANFKLAPEEISADKAYGTTVNRAYLKDNKITTSIDFYDESSRETQYFGINDFEISSDLKFATCPNKITTNNCKQVYCKSRNLNELAFYFEKKICNNCPLRQQCFSQKPQGGRTLKVPQRYDAVMQDKEHNKTEGFKEAINKRCKVERRFATMVRNHGLRRCRFLRLKGAQIHITLANTACNIVRMVNLIFTKDHPSFAMSRIA